MTIQIAPPQGGFGTWTTWAGTFNTANNNKPAICITEGVPAGMAPGGATPFTSDPILMREIALYANTTDPLTAAGLAYEGHTEGADSPGAAAQWINSPDPNIGAIKAKAAEIRAAATGTAGPYTVSPVLAFTPGSSKGGTVSNTQLVSASGNALPSVPATLTYTNGTGTSAINTGDTASWAATASGPVGVKESVANVPSSNGIAYVVPGQQTMLVAGDTTTVEGASQDLTARLDFQPTATTNAPKYYNAGDTFTDLIHPSTSTGNMNDWIKDNNGNPIPGIYQVDVYQAVPLVGGKTLPADAKPIGSGTVTTTGADVTFTATSGVTKAPSAGSYFTVAKFIKANQPANLQQYFTGDWTETDLTNQVSVVKATPKFQTTLIDNGDGTVSDKITMICDSTDSVNTLVSVTPVLNSSASAPVPGGTPTAPADNKVQATLPAITIHCGETVTTASVKKPWDSIVNDYWNANPSVAKPTLFFTETAPATATTNEVKAVYLHPDESIQLINPTVTTKASENGTVPVTAKDTATVTGTIPSGKDVTTELNWKLFKFGNDTTGSVQAICENEFWKSASPVTVPKAGDYTSAPVTLNDDGTYGYVETLTVTYPTANGGTKTTVLHTGKCGETSESVIAFPVGTTATPGKNVSPMANTGDITPHQDMNNVLLVGGLAGLGAIIVALIAIGSARYQKRRVAAMNTGDENGTHADELTE